LGHPQMLGHLKEARSWATVKVGEGSQLRRGEKGSSVSAHLLVDGTHDLREGLQYRLGALIGQVCCSHGLFYPWLMWRKQVKSSPNR